MMKLVPFQCFVCVLFTLLLTPSCASFKQSRIEPERVILAERMPSYRELAIKDFDQMKEKVSSYRDRALEGIDNSSYDTEQSKDSVAITPLYKGLRFLLSRPDRDDNMVSKLVPFIRFELTHINQYQSVLEDLSKEAVAGVLHNDIPVKRQATYYFVLENLIAEIKPDIARKPRIKAIFEYIRDANITLSPKLHSELLLNTMFKPTSPSDIARKILNKKFKDK